MVFYFWLPVFVLYGACALINFLTISPKVSIISDPENFLYISDQSKSARSEFSPKKFMEISCLKFNDVIYWLVRKRCFICKHIVVCVEWLFVGTNILYLVVGT